MSVANLSKLYALADDIDRREGRLAYARYNALMRSIAEAYNSDLLRVTAAFAALSPNNDYLGNLRSLVSILVGMRECIPLDRITVSTYEACRDRAYSYLIGDADFWTTVKGPKIRAFYRNIIRPADTDYVTIDGHMAAAYAGNSGTMKENIVKNSGDYITIAAAVKTLARR